MSTSAQISHFPFLEYYRHLIPKVPKPMNLGFLNVTCPQIPHNLQTYAFFRLTIIVPYGTSSLPSFLCNLFMPFILNNS